jgi:hypothetical protein
VRRVNKAKRLSSDSGSPCPRTEPSARRVPPTAESMRALLTRQQSRAAGKRWNEGNARDSLFFCIYVHGRRTLKSNREKGPFLLFPSPSLPPSSYSLLLCAFILRSLSLKVSRHLPSFHPLCSTFLPLNNHLFNRPIDAHSHFKLLSRVSSLLFAHPLSSPHPAIQPSIMSAPETTPAAPVPAPVAETAPEVAAPVAPKEETPAPAVSFRIPVHHGAV